MFFTRLLTLFAIGMAFISPAFAKKVVVEWEALEEAKGYEIEISQNSKILVAEKLKQTIWKGDLDFGAYAYRIRAVDKEGFAGQWSDYVPLVAMITAPKIVAPHLDETVPLFSRQQTTKVRWQSAGKGFSHQLTILRGTEKFLSETVSGQTRDYVLPSGAYTILLKTQIPVPSELQALRNEPWYSEEAVVNFQIENRKLQPPSFFSPSGQILMSETLKMAWEKTDGADAYDLKLLTQNPAAKVLLKKTYSQNEIEIPFDDSGDFEVQIRSKNTKLKLLSDWKSYRFQITRQRALQPKRWVFDFGEQLIRQNGSILSYSPYFSWSPQWPLDYRLSVRGELYAYAVSVAAPKKETMPVLGGGAWIGVSPLESRSFYAEIGAATEVWNLKDLWVPYGVSLRWQPDVESMLWWNGAFAKFTKVKVEGIDLWQMGFGLSFCLDPLFTSKGP